MMQTITIKFKVSNSTMKRLRKVAKGWGHRTVAAYMKELIAVKIGKP